MSDEKESDVSDGESYENKVILASGGYDHSIRFWHAEKGFCERIIQSTDNSHINAMAITPNRQMLATAGFQHVRLYDVDIYSGNALINYEGISKNVCSIGFNNVGSLMYTGGEDCYARMWDIRTRHLYVQRKQKFQSAINSTFLHPSQNELYVADQSGCIWIWNLRNDKVQRVFVTNYGFIQHMAFDEESRLLAAVDTRGNCFVYLSTPSYPTDVIDQGSFEITSNGILHRKLMFQAHNKFALKCCFSPDSTLLATTSADQTVKFWRTSDLSIVNPTSFVQFKDPDEEIEDDPEAQKNNYSSTGHYYKNYNDVDDENFELEKSFANPSTSFLGSPYLADLFAQGMQPMRPPPCYLKPRRPNKNCKIHGQNSWNQNGSNEASHCCKKSHNGASNDMPMNASSCASCNSYQLRQTTSFNYLQPNITSLSQLGWNVYGMNKNGPNSRLSNTDPMNSPVKRCNHYSHYSYSRAKIGVFADYYTPSSVNDFSGQFGDKDKSGHRHHHHHHYQNHCQQFYPKYYIRYFDNKYYKLFSRSDNPNETGEVDYSEISPEELEEDIEFYNIIKNIKLIDSDEENDDDDDEGIRCCDTENYYCSQNGGKFPEDAYDLSNSVDVVASDIQFSNRISPGVIGGERNTIGKSTRSKSATNSRSNSSSRSSSKLRNAPNECCCSCDCFSNKSGSDQTNGQYGSNTFDYGCKMTPNNNNSLVGTGANSSKKNEWPFSNLITPLKVLKAANQKWVWDIAFSADSQYVFTASSDQHVRLWSVLTGELTRQYTGHQKAVTSIAFSDVIP